MIMGWCGIDNLAAVPAIWTQLLNAESTADAKKSLYKAVMNDAQKAQIDITKPVYSDNFAEMLMKFELAPESTPVYSTLKIISVSLSSSYKHQKDKKNINARKRPVETWKH